ncbi:hypothetical protein PF008_g30654 [Phytophthora fragariae]|uniref:Uncharacterized protein n=1 Tax=Phytophthora fragariae TaxID=53985 RepID=A0A6G0Q4Y6_9STRA|nr:hypothetical protein PF008_g30654 [Phytophthora fragariae]
MWSPPPNKASRSACTEPRSVKESRRRGPGAEKRAMLHGTA